MLRLCIQYYDKLSSGRVAAEVMRSCIDWICVSETCFNDLYINAREMELLINIYKDPTTHDKVLWKVFKSDLERGKCLSSTVLKTKNTSINFFHFTMYFIDGKS